MAQYAGFWIRLAAYIVDSIIVSFASITLGVLVGLLFTPVSADAGIIAGFITLFVVAIGGDWLYHSLLESSTKQATWGKQLFKLKVTNLQGGRIGFGRATARFWAKWLTTQIFAPLLIIVGLTERKQGLHDMIAETYVINEPTRVPTAPVRTTSTVRKKAAKKKRR